MNKRLQLAGCIIQNINGEILLLHRNTPARTQWELPGGKIDPGENPKSAAIREVKEELGIDVEIVSEAGRHEFNEDGYINDYIWFNANILSREPHPQEAMHDKVEYFSWESLRDMKNTLSSNAKNLVDAYSNNQLKLPE
jgi:8-oxo-dGTP diphosphatase